MKAGGSAVTKGCVVAAEPAVKVGVPAYTETDCGNQGTACIPIAGFASLLAGGPALVCLCTALEMAVNRGELPTSSPTVRAMHERKTHS